MSQSPLACSKCSPAGITSKSVGYFRYREHSRSYIDTHMRLSISVVRDGQVSPIYYLIDADQFHWQQASAKIMGVCGLLEG